MKQLYVGDCLEVLKELHQEHPDGFIDLIYIDPPFNSKRDYNVLFESLDMSDANAQKQAFADTWSNVGYLDTLNEIQDLDLDLYQFLKNLDAIRISKSAVAYLTTMAIRIHYMHRVLKETGSFYLHCDPTMSHYLKLVCDLVFGSQFFRNEITWVRTNAQNFKPRYFSRIQDTILFYTKSDTYTWVPQYQEYSEQQLKRFKPEVGTGKMYKAENLTITGSSPHRNFLWRGTRPPANRVWALSMDKLEELWEEGRILKKTDGTPRLDGLKVYLDDLPGKALGCVWDDIDRVGNTSAERLGYPTQKPEALLERILTASTNEGDLVADFFCGCGTTIAVAERLNRQWVGSDISHLAVKLVMKRLTDPYRRQREKLKALRDSIAVKNIPTDVASARMLAEEGEHSRFKFQDWVIEFMLGGVSNPKKVADGGFDGYMTFNTSPKKKETVLIEVKSGGAGVKNLREFIQVVKSREAAIGVFVCFAEHISGPMQHEAKKEGYYDQEHWGNRFPRIQLVSVEDLLDGKSAEMPESMQTTFKTSVKKGTQYNEQLEL